MVDVAFEYKKLFKGAKQEEVFDAVLEWLQKKGAKIKKAERPDLIESVYGRANAKWNWDKEMLRTVDFELVSSKEYVGLSVWQAPTRKSEKRVLESPFQANIIWKDWLNECWDHVQSKVTPTPAAPGTPMRIPAAKAAAAEKPPSAPAPAPAPGPAGAPPPPPKPAAPLPPPPKAPPPPKPKEGEGETKESA
jgi:hypothetical protein